MRKHGLKKLFRLDRGRARRAAAFARARLAARKRQAPQTASRALPLEAAPIPGGYDPELLYVECGRCGAPVLWEDGRATELLKQAGIDPLELDSSCMLVTEGCPVCGSAGEYGVRIYRITEHTSMPLPPSYGHA